MEVNIKKTLPQMTLKPAGIVGNIHIKSGFGTQNQDEYFTPTGEKYDRTN